MMRLVHEVVTAAAVAFAVTAAQCAAARCRGADEGARPLAAAVRVVGLRNARRAIREAVLVPMRAHAMRTALHPLLRPCNGVLLHGPPGTGKTLLARWTAARVGAFFAVGPTAVQSKWYGETPRLVHALFASARRAAPSVLFFDELDGLLGARSARDQGAERELKTTLLSEMSRLEHAGAPVVVMGATNRVGDVDAAVLRRMRLRVHVGLPDARARARCVRAFLPEVSAADASAVACATRGFSCSDLLEVAKAAVARSHALRADGGVGVARADVLGAAAALRAGIEG
jgi:ATP-dependent 26S proteasome regulatory subunit